MAFSVSSAPTSTSNLHSIQPNRHPFSSFPISVSFLFSNSCRSLPTLRFPLCFSASKSQTGPAKKQKQPPSKKRKKKNETANLKDVEILNDGDEGGDLGVVVRDSKSSSRGSKSSSSGSNSRSLSYQPSTLPKPPAGFVIDDHGRVLMASSRRLATIIDSTNNYPLECVVRRVFRSSQGDECMLLCPVDTPVQILKSTNIDGWSAVSDEEVEAILPSAAYALAKIHMHLVYSGFCYTARGGFCYSEDDIFDFRTDDGQDVDGLPTEGIEVTCFHLDGAHYMIYTPSDPLLFVAVKGQNGELQIADDELLEDPAIVGAIDEETEFNALVEEEAALLESLLGER